MQISGTTLTLGVLGAVTAAAYVKRGGFNGVERQVTQSDIDDNAAIMDARGGGTALSIEGKYIGTYHDDPEPKRGRSFEQVTGRKAWRDERQNALKAFNDWCDKHGYYPSLYWISDHGNAVLLDPKTGRQLLSRAKRGARNEDEAEGQIEPQGGFGLMPARQRALPQLRRRAELQLPDERLADILFDRDGDVLGGMTFERAVKQDPRRVDAKISQRIGEAFEQVFGPHQGDPAMKSLYLQGLDLARQTHEGQVPVKALVSLVEENLNRALYTTFPRMPHDARTVLRRSQPIFDAAFADAARMAAQASRAAAGTEDGPEWRALAEILAEHPQHMRRALGEVLPGPVGPRDRMLGGPGQFRALPGPRGGRNIGSRCTCGSGSGWGSLNQSCRVHGARNGRSRPLSVIAAEIRRDWKKPYFGAVPYLEAMGTLDSVRDNYGYDSGTDIVLYFLSNANTWKGETAKRVKAELKQALKGR